VSAGRVLVADDEPSLARALGRQLAGAGFQVDTATDGRAAAEMARGTRYDVIVSDISMPGMTGIELLRAVRQRDLDVPVILMTAQPAVETAIAAVELGALRYLPKPIDGATLIQVATQAVRLHRLALVKREALRLIGTRAVEPGDRAGLEARFESALAELWLAFQPIVSVSERRVFAYEGLLRTGEPTLPDPGAVLAAAERLGRLPDLGRAIRARAAEAAGSLPDGALMFINLHPLDFIDHTLYEPDSPLSRFAGRVVLEVTERAALDGVDRVRDRVARLRALGFRVAIDDLGAGYAGLSSFASLEPEVVKIDMSLVRDVEQVRTKAKLIETLAGLCRDLGMQVVVEGVETASERDVLVGLGCDLLQGYLYARPGPPFVSPVW
jgi:EAL domain-containing protein (putative c-di-GMP-specific phosphodiesterase class I)